MSDLHFWQLSFFKRAIIWRYLITPIGTLNTQFNVDGLHFRYTDIYVFGVRIARIQRSV